MTRRILLLGLIATPLIALTTSHEVSEADDEFIGALGPWARMWNTRVHQHSGTASVPEEMAWQTVKHTWKGLSKRVDEYYRGL